MPFFTLLPAFWAHLRLRHPPSDRIFGFLRSLLRSLLSDLDRVFSGLFGVLLSEHRGWKGVQIFVTVPRILLFMLDETRTVSSDSVA